MNAYSKGAPTGPGAPGVCARRKEGAVTNEGRGKAGDPGSYFGAQTEWIDRKGVFYEADKKVIVRKQVIVAHLDCQNGARCLLFCH